MPRSESRQTSQVGGAGEDAVPSAPSRTEEPPQAVPRSESRQTSRVGGAGEDAVPPAPSRTEEPPQAVPRSESRQGAARNLSGGGFQLIYPLSTVVMQLAPSPVLRPGKDPTSLVASLRRFDIRSGSLDSTPQSERNALDAEFNCPTFRLSDGAVAEEFDPEKTRLSTARIRSEGLLAAVAAYGREYFESRQRGSLHDLTVAFPNVEDAAMSRLLALHASGRVLRMRPEWRPNGAAAAIGSDRPSHPHHSIIRHHL